MSNPGDVLYLLPEHDPPFAVIASRAAGTGHWGGHAHCVFLVVAWDTEEEQDLLFARFNTRAPGYSGGTIYYSSSADLPITASDTVTVSWTSPRRMPHHISVYYQALATYDPTLPATKILPSSGLVRGNIPGYATSVTIAYDTAITYEYQVQAWVDSGKYILRGNRMACLYPNAQIVPYPAGGVAQDITASAYGVQSIDEGENSFITVHTPTPGTTYIDFMAGPFCPYHDSNIALFEPLIFFNYPDIHVEQNDKSGLDILSIPYQKSVIGGNFSGTLHVTNVMGSTYSGTLGPNAGVNKNDARYACYYLQKWRDAGIPLMFYVEQQGSDYDVNYPHAWYGQLIDVPHMGLRDAQDDNEISFTAKINYIQPNTFDLGWWKIVAKDTGANTISINGDHTAQFIAGAKIRTSGSTADNGLWAVASSVYTGGNTVISVTGDITDGTADGRVELWLRR